MTENFKKCINISMGVLDINPNKFNFVSTENGKEILIKNKANLLSIIKQEKLNAAGKGHALLDYFCYRELIIALMNNDPANFLLSGSNAILTYTDSYRIPTDVDIEIIDIKKAQENLEDTVSDFNKEGIITYNLKISSDNSANRIFRANLKSKLMGLEQNVAIDMASRMYFVSNELRVLGKLISTDNECLVKVPALENFIVKKALAVLERIAFKPESNHYCVKDFYDIYKLLAMGIDDKLISKYTKAEIEVRQNYNNFYKNNDSSLKNIQKNLPNCLESIDKMWERFITKRVVITDDAKILNIKNIATNFIQNLEL